MASSFTGFIALLPSCSAPYMVLYILGRTAKPTSDASRRCFASVRPSLTTRPTRHPPQGGHRRAGTRTEQSILAGHHRSCDTASPTPATARCTTSSTAAAARWRSCTRPPVLGRVPRRPARARRALPGDRDGHPRNSAHPAARASPGASNCSPPGCSTCATISAQVALVGHHTGAVIAVEVVAVAPDRVRALVLSGMPFVHAERGRVVACRPAIDHLVPAADGSHLARL